MRNRGIGALLVTSGALLLCVAHALYGAAASDQWSQMIREVEAKQKAPRTDLSTRKSKAIDLALKDPAAMWGVLTSPNTRYLDRMAVAQRAVFPPEYLGKLVKARAELSREEKMHFWGLKQHPMDAVPREPCDPRSVPAKMRARHILGHTWRIPAQASDYPITEAEESEAPWPWQAQQALGSLWGMLKSQVHDDEWSKRWVTEALKLPGGTDEEACVFVDTTDLHCSQFSPAVLSRWMSIALSEGRSSAGGQAVQAISSNLRGPMAQAMLSDVILGSHNIRVTQTAVWSIYDLREPWRKDQKLPLLPEPATAILAASKKALDTQTGNNHERLYMANGVCKAVDDPPFEPDYSLDPKSSEVERRLDTFRKWFDAREARLELAADAEKPKLDEARQILKSEDVWRPAKR